jgi:outer membrane protein TolC
VTPNDSAIRPNWWEMYQDPQLDKLEEQVAVSNQTLKASYEQYMQARAAIQFYRSQYFPTLSGRPLGYARAPVDQPSLACCREQDHLQRSRSAGTSNLGTGSLGQHPQIGGIAAGHCPGHRC